MPDDENFDSFRLDAVEQLVGEAGEQSHPPTFVGWRSVIGIALDAGDDGGELVKELVAEAFGGALVVAPCVIKVPLDQCVIHHVHRRRL